MQQYPIVTSNKKLHDNHNHISLYAQKFDTKVLDSNTMQFEGDIDLCKIFISNVFTHKLIKQ